MTGYTRNDTTNNIANGNVINAADLDGEFDAIQSAFDASTGHAHDGTVGGGAPIEALGPAQDVVITASVLRPKTDNTVDLGTSTLEFKDLYLDGTAKVDTLTVDESATITANLTVNGNTTLGNAATDTVTVTADVASHLIPATDNTYDLGTPTDEWRDLYIDGTANIDSLVADTADINGGTIDGATIATSDITVGSGKTLNVSAGTLTLADNQISGDKVEGGTINAITINTLGSTTGNITTVNATTIDSTNLEVTNIKAKDGTASATIADSTGVMTVASAVLTTADINGGTIDGATIGGSSAAAGTFTTATATTGNITTVNATTVDTTNIEVTTLKAKDGTSAGSIADSTGVVTLASSVLTTTDINGGTIDGAVIGGSSAAAGTFTTVTASGDLTIADKIVHSGDTNTSIRFPAADTVTVETSGAERLRVDTSGNVGIGTSSPSRKLVLEDTSSAPFISLQGASGADGGILWGTSGVGDAQGQLRYHNSSNYMMFSTSSQERMRIDASGNLGLGVTPNAWHVNFKAIQAGNYSSFAGDNSNGYTEVLNNAYASGASTFNYSASLAATRYSQQLGSHKWFVAGAGSTGNAITFTQAMTLDASGRILVGQTSASIGASGSIHSTIAGSSNTANLYLSSGGPGDPASSSNVTPRIDFSASGLSSFGTTYIGATGAYNGRSLVFYTGADTAGTERARIDASGNLLVGTTAPDPISSNVAGISLGSDSIVRAMASSAPSGVFGRKTSTGDIIRFYYNGPTQIGSISTDGSSTTYNTSSDYRLKENVAPMQNALDTVARLNPVTYTWKADGSAGQGFIAHELQAVVPDCVTGEKDAVDAEGNPQYQGVDTSFLVATLVKAIQELKAEVDGLRAQLNP